jgi:hypothetical protein
MPPRRGGCAFAGSVLFGVAVIAGCSQVLLGRTQRLRPPEEGSQTDFRGLNINDRVSVFLPSAWLCMLTTGSTSPEGKIMGWDVVTTDGKERIFAEIDLDPPNENGSGVEQERFDCNLEVGAVHKIEQ